MVFQDMFHFLPGPFGKALPSLTSFKTGLRRIPLWGGAGVYCLLAAAEGFLVRT